MDGQESVLSHSATPIDLLEAEDEESTRVLLHTPSLLAARKNLKTKPEIDHTRNVLPALEKIMEVACTQHNSTVVLQAKIARVFVETSSVPEPWRHIKNKVANSWEPEVWSKIFRANKGQGKAKTKVSSKLTGSWLDAEFLIELVDDKDTPLFRPPQGEPEGMPEQRTLVEMICKDSRTGNRVHITIPDKQKIEVRGLRVLLGSINMHFPDRRWDASFVMNAAKNVPKEVVAPFQLLIDNLSICTPSQDYSTTPFMTSTKGSKTIEIESVTLRREVVYQSNPTIAEDVEMTISKVQQLRIVELDDGSIQAWLAADDDDRSTRLRWWEMNLNSPHINEVFAAENPSLQVGELAKYEAWDTVKPKFAGLMNMAREVVPRIDIVGQPSR